MIDRPSDGDDLDTPSDRSSMGDTTPGQRTYEQQIAQAKEADIAQLPEITVQGRPIPWWVWGLVGALAVMAFVNRKGSRS